MIVIVLIHTVLSLLTCSISHFCPVFSFVLSDRYFLAKLQLGTGMLLSLSPSARHNCGTCMAWLGRRCFFRCSERRATGWGQPKARGGTTRTTDQEMECPRTTGWVIERFRRTSSRHGQRSREGGVDGWMEEGRTRPAYRLKATPRSSHPCSGNRSHGFVAVGFKGDCTPYRPFDDATVKIRHRHGSLLVLFGLLWP